MSIAQRLQDKGERIGWEKGERVGWEKGHLSGIEKGIIQGIEKGIVQGIEQERLRAYHRQLEMARHLLKNDINIELVIESTGLSREELSSL
ncbi:hypothetical protein [Proteus myxofaciens]|uniref:Transposase n=1 Tax=Proteus myxofaciens ATCC 19692 TaxID=1354337 RepID=A0A198F5W1_9GAMM|nr:hypothetical protein [Proteus myxofaciens]OAT20257.1 transposase [Proteus myxofaciens ATCC 19692]